jgi:D-alanyl-D-alanine carboxypeptidase
MHLSRRFVIVFVSFFASLAILRSAVAAQAYVIVDSKTGYILEEQEPGKNFKWAA